MVVADTEIREKFASRVNMTARQLEEWLQTPQSKSVGQKTNGAGEATGHAEGRHIVEILRKKKGDLTEDDEKHMHRVVGYIERHLAQRPDKDVHDTPWRCSLMNWGHDPEHGK
jgi:uncharacterized protein DUF3140